MTAFRCRQRDQSVREAMVARPRRHGAGVARRVADNQSKKLTVPFGGAPHRLAARPLRQRNAAPRTPTRSWPHKTRRPCRLAPSPHPLALRESGHDGAHKLGVSPRRPTPLTFSRHLVVDRHPISKIHRRDAALLPLAASGRGRGAGGGDAGGGRREDRRPEPAPGLRRRVGEAQCALLRRRPGGGAGPGPGDRVQAGVQGPLPLRAVRSRHQARRRRVRGHHHLLLHLHGWRAARRGGLRVPGQRERRALHPAHQHLQRRQGRARAAVRALVRPHRRLPHLLHPLEPTQHHPVHRRDADPGVQEQRSERGTVPDAAAGARLRQHLERRGVGDAGRARQDGLVGGAVRGRVPAVRRDQRLRLARREVAHAVRRRPPAVVGVVVDDAEAGLVELDDAQLGAHELHDLRLLRRPEAVPPRVPHRVHHPHRQDLI